jgi:DNA-binding response OmpR family regulator
MEAHEVQCGPFRVDLRNECVWDEAGALHLRPKTFAVLRYFVAHPDRLVTKDELLAAVWPETVVHEAARTELHTVRDLREELMRLAENTPTPAFHPRGHTMGWGLRCSGLASWS